VREKEAPVAFTLGRKALVLAVVLGLLVAFGVGFGAYAVSGRLFRESMVRSKLSLVSTIARSIDGDEHARLTGRAAMRDPAYQRLLTYLHGVRATESFVTYLYTLVPDGKGGLVYTVDADLAETDILWVESGVFAFFVTFTEDGAAKAVFEQEERPSRFGVTVNGKTVPVSLERGSWGTRLRVGSTVVSEIPTGLPRQVFTPGGTLQESAREAEVAVETPAGTIPLHLTLSLKGESQSLPGQPYVDTPLDVEKLKGILARGADWADPEPQRDSYGLSLSFFGIIRGAAGPAGLVAMDIYQDELTAFGRSMVSACALFAGIVFAVIIAALFAFSRYLTVPLSALTLAARRVSTGDLTVSLRLRRRDELGVLADTFNRMVGALARHREERESTEQHLKELAYHDALTGVLNRKAFYERFAEAILLSKRSSDGGYRALILLDLDRFKEVNDTLGHDAGDVVITETSRRIRATVRGSDLVFRLGGDEFAVLLMTLADETDAALVAGKLLAAVEKPYAVAGQQARLGMCAGITLFPRDGDTVDTLFNHADMALYEAKSQRMTYRFFTRALQDRAAERFGLIADLHAAVEAGQFELHYQPIVDRGGRLAGAETLMRWTHPVRGRVPPAAFIPALEDTGLIIPVGKWALAEACRGLVSFRASGLQDVVVSVNMSLKQFQDRELMPAIRSVLAKTGLPAGALKVEITESLLMEDASATRTMRVLHDEGVRFSIDDFGTGYSSLARLKDLPVDEVKIDRSFLAGIPGSRSDCEVAKVVVAIAHEFGLSVVAEGVETEAQHEFLQGAGCDLFQGYLYSPAVPAGSLIGLAFQLERVAVPRG
jgi:diguanylate cyclase (GGDEF)-like protein